MATIYFTKRFDSGVLKGLTYNSAITFPDGEESLRHYTAAFHRGAKGRDAITKTRYTIIDASFQNYQR